MGSLYIARTKKRFWVLTALALTLALLATYTWLTYSGHDAHAARREDWIAGNIVSDGEFMNSNGMSVADIQTFLDNKIGGCDVWGTGPSEYGGGTRAQYAASRGWPGPPYTCLNLYYEVPKSDPGGSMPANNYSNPSVRPYGSQSAAWIIKNAADRFRINPKILLVKIATESAGPLTGDKWPLFYQYQYSMGAQCPDSGPNGSANCDPAYAGFSIQINEAARLMRTYINNMDQPWYGYTENGKKTQFPANRCSGSGPGEGVKVPFTDNCILWNVKQRGCGAQNIYIENKATAALYTYTPYQPNAAALNNMYGSGDNCSAYGNRNFWRVYWDWFGSTRNSTGYDAIEKRYTDLGGSSGMLGSATSNYTCGLQGGGCFQNYQNGAIVWSPSSGAWESKGGIRSRWATLGYESSSLGYPTGPENWDGTGWWQAYQGGAIIGTAQTDFWESKGGIRSRWATLGYQGGTLGYPTSGEVWDGTGWWQNYQNGAIIGTLQTGFWESKNGAIRDRWNQLNYQYGALGYPTSSVVCGIKDNGCYQNYQTGAILWSQTSGAWESHGGIRERYAKLGFENSTLGYPTSGEVWDGTGWWQNYQNGAIIGTLQTGFWESKNGAIRDRWNQLNYQYGALGYPTSSVVCGIKDNGCYQNYQTGAILWSQTSGAWESHGGIRERYAKLGFENSTLGYPTSGESYSDSLKTWSQAYQRGSIYYSNVRGSWYE